MFNAFPRYYDYDPKVPVWCITPNRGGCIHRFFDTSPISPSGRYAALFRFPFEDKMSEPGDRGEIVLIDLSTGEEQVVAETSGWEAQMGANINWGGTDDELYFNDVEPGAWLPFAWKLNPKTGVKRRMEGTVYHASSDGKWLISANMTTMRKTQPGYGVTVPDAAVRRNVGPSTDDGFYLTDTSTGKTKLFLSIAEILERADPPIRIENPQAQEIYGFHSKFNPQGDRLMLSLRWFPAHPEPRWNLFKTSPKEVRFAWVTVDLAKTKIACAVGPEQWVKGGHHGTWFPDGRRISMNLNIDQEENIRFVQVNEDGSDLRKMRDDVWGSGHPTVHRDLINLVTDTYTQEPTAFGDGTVPIRIVNLETGTEEVLVRINTAQPAADKTLRVDPHPAWDRSWRFLTFNAFVGGTRRVFIADMASKVGMEPYST